MSFLLPAHADYIQSRVHGDRVFSTGIFTRLPDLAQCIVDDMRADYQHVRDFPFGVNAWVYGERFVSFEVYGMLDIELDQPQMVDDAVIELREFIARYNWENLDDEEDCRFICGGLLLCNEAEQAFRPRTGRVWVDRWWRKWLGHKYQPFVPLDTSTL